MHYLTLGYLTLNSPPADTITAAAEGGFKSVGLRISGRRIGDPYTQVIGNPPMIREIKRRIDDSGMRLSNVIGYYIVPDIEWSHLQSVVETAAELGSQIVVVVNHVPIDAKLIDLFGRYCALAGRYGIRVAVEFMIYSQTKTLELARQMVDGSGQANAGYLIDPLHLYRSGGTPDAIKQVDPKRIILAQLCDAKKGKNNPTNEELVAEARNERLAPGDGELPLYDFLDALPPDTEIEYEVPRPEQLGLPLTERAKIAASRFKAYMAEYARQRGRTDPWPVE
jgi:sugar phosphate isomerase/epimerase